MEPQEIGDSLAKVFFSGGPEDYQLAAVHYQGQTFFGLTCYKVVMAKVDNEEFVLLEQPLDIVLQQQGGHLDVLQVKIAEELHAPFQALIHNLLREPGYKVLDVSIGE